MRIVGFSNVVTKSGNIGVKVCVTGEWSTWDKEHGSPKGEKSEMWYVSKVHLSETDIGRPVRFIMGKYDGRPYVREMLFLDAYET